MKRVAMLALTIMVLPLGLWAAPQWQVDQALKDVGSVRQGQIAAAVFVVTNRGDRPLELKPRGCCGISVNAPDGLTVRPGGRARLAISYETAYLSGNFAKRVAVTTNDPKQPETGLTLRGQILTELEIKPELLDFGQVKAGAVARQRLTIINCGKQRVTLSDLRLKPTRCFSLAAHSPAFIEPGQSIQLEVIFIPPDVSGSVWGALKFTTDLAYLPTRTVPIRAVVR